MPTRRFQEVLTCREVDKTPSEHASLVGLNDVADELFDVPEPSDSDLVENGWLSDFGSEMYSQNIRYPTLSTAAGFVTQKNRMILQFRREVIWT